MTHITPHSDCFVWDSQQYHSCCYSNVPWVAVQVFWFNVLRLMLRF